MLMCWRYIGYIRFGVDVRLGLMGVLIWRQLSLSGWHSLQDMEAYGYNRRIDIAIGLKFICRWC